MIDWESLFENWPKAVFVIDREGIILYKNKVMSDLKSLPWDNLLDAFDKPPDSVYFYIRGEGHSGLEPLKTMVKLQDGPLCDLILSNLPESNRIAGELRLLEGAGDQQIKRLEEVLQEIRKLGHDMCQPLTVILGQSEIMQLTNSQDEELNRRLSAIISEAEKLETMIRKLSLLIQYRHQD